MIPPQPQLNSVAPVQSLNLHQTTEMTSRNMLTLFTPRTITPAPNTEEEQLEVHNESHHTGQNHSHDQCNYHAPTEKYLTINNTTIVKVIISSQSIQIMKNQNPIVNRVIIKLQKKHTWKATSKSYIQIKDTEQYTS